jgi:hypothetical protein
MGPLCSLPWGYIGFTAVMCILQCLIGAILWKTMYHEPDDERGYDEKPHFVLQDNDQMTRKT